MQQKISLKQLSAVLVFSLVSLHVSAEGLIESCNHCHDGQKKDVPVIAGISSVALENSLLAYIEGLREARPFEGQDMKTIVQNLSEDDFKKIVEHYASLPFTPVKQTVDAPLAEKGKKIHDAYCERCHTEGGSVAEDDSSILAGQWKGYLLEEMKHYKAGSRTGDRKMSEVMKSLSEEHLKALSEYYASQQ